MQYTNNVDTIFLLLEYIQNRGKLNIGFSIFIH